MRFWPFAKAEDRAAGGFTELWVNSYSRKRGATSTPMLQRPQQPSYAPDCGAAPSHRLNSPRPSQESGRTRWKASPGP